MDRDTLAALLKLVNNCTANSMDPAERWAFYAERKRLADLLRRELQGEKANA